MQSALDWAFMTAPQANLNGSTSSPYVLEQTLELGLISLVLGCRFRLLASRKGVSRWSDGREEADRRACSQLVGGSSAMSGSE
jgi:hypothetical protein